MPPKIRRWIPLSIVLVAVFFLWNVSRPVVKFEDEKNIEKMPLPRKAKEYILPVDIKNPFNAKVVLQMPEEMLPNPNKAPEEKGASAPPSTQMRIDGIIWTRQKSLVSLNGRLLKEGQQFRGGRVLSIEPTLVTLEIAGQIIHKRITP